MRDDNRIEVVRNRFGFNSLRGISWSAVLAGVAVALAVSLLLAFLGAGIGASTINPLEERNPFSGLGVGAMIWMVLAGIVAYFIGGWVSGYGNGGLITRTEALTHGLATWAVATILSVWFITGAAGSLLSGGASLIGGGAQAASQSTELSQSVREELQRRGIDVDRIQEQAKSPETQARAEQMARQAGETVARGISMTALGAFAMLLINLIGSLLGAFAAARRSDREFTRVERERVA